MLGAQVRLDVLGPNRIAPALGPTIPNLCGYTASVTSSGGRLCPRLRLPSRVVQLHLVGLLGTIPSTGWRGDATQLLERAGVVIGPRCSAIAARRSRPMPFEPAVKRTD